MNYTALLSTQISGAHCETQDDRGPPRAVLFHFRRSPDLVVKAGRTRNPHYQHKYVAGYVELKATEVGLEKRSGHCRYSQAPVDLEEALQESDRCIVDSVVGLAAG